PALDPAGLRPRLRRQIRVRRDPLQDHRLLAPGARTLATLERPGARHRLGRERADLVGEGPGRESAGGGGKLRLRRARQHHSGTEATKPSFLASRLIKWSAPIAALLLTLKINVSRAARIFS